MRQLLLAMLLAFSFAAHSQIKAPAASPAPSTQTADVPVKGDHMRTIFQNSEMAVKVDLNSIRGEGDVKNSLVAFLFEEDAAPAEGVYAVIGRLEFNCKNNTVVEKSHAVLDDHLVVLSSSIDPPRQPIPVQGVVATKAMELTCGVVEPTLALGQKEAEALQ